MATLLIIHHTPSPALRALLEAVADGAGTDAIADVEVALRPALTCPETDVLDADGYVLGTPANLGSMSGALKHCFDRIYYPCLEATRGRPYGLYVHGNDDTTGAVRSVDRVVKGLAWQQVAPTLASVGTPDRGTLDQAWELGATVAARLSEEAAG